MVIWLTRKLLMLSTIYSNSTMPPYHNYKIFYHPCLFLHLLLEFFERGLIYELGTPELIVSRISTWDKI